MFALLRRYLRRVDALYLALCAACSAVSVVVLVSIGQTQLGSNNKASVQLIASFLGIMLAFIFSTVDYRALARAWPLHATVAWGLVLPTLFLHNFRAGVVTIGYDAGGTSNYSWYRVGGMTFQPAELAKISFILTLALHLSRVRGRVNQPKNLLLLLLHIGVPTALIHIQGDDGTALVFLGIGVFMLYAGGLSNWVAGGALAAGFVGAAAVLALLLGVCLRTLTAALQSRDALGRNICVGIFAALFLQTVINLGMNLQVLPVIGVTLPFFSAGGSSVVMMYFCVGLVLSVGLQARRSRVDAVAIL